MKIALRYKHQGVGNQMIQALGDHEIVDYSSKSDDYPIREEILVSCIPHSEFKYIPESQKVLMYATDGTSPERLEDWEKIQSRPLTRVVIDGDCIQFANKDYYPIKRVDYTIPLSINPDIMPKFKGDINAIAICNRKPEERWNMITDKFFGRYAPLNWFLRSIPYCMIHVPDDKDFFEMISHYRGAFFFSHSQNCLVLYELMAMNMPIVGFNYSLTDNPGIIIEKYLHHYSTNDRDVTEMLQGFLNDPKPEYYNTMMPFQECKNLWNKAIKEVHEI